MINWEKFIQAGFEKSEEKVKSDLELLKYGPENIVKENSLEIRWYEKDGLKYFTVVCRCGNNRMLYHENGIRCHMCGRFHSHDSFNKKRLEARKKAKNYDGRIEQLPQPMVYDKNRLSSIASEKRRFFASLAQDGGTGVGSSAVYTRSSVGSGASGFIK